MKTIVFTCLLNILTGSLALAGKQNICAKLFTNQSVSLVRAELENDLSRSRDVLKNLAVKSLEIIPERVLGRGASGYVVEIIYGGRRYALKVFHAEDSTETIVPSETKEAIVIQRKLGELNVSPKVIGILDQTQIISWTHKYSGILNKILPEMNSTIYFGLIMELTNTLSLQTDIDASPIEITRAQKRKLFQQATQIDKTIKGLGVIARDVDATITSEGNLLLIDIGGYLHQSMGSAIYPAKNVKEHLKKLITLGTVIN